MSKINVKESILTVVKKSNLEILKIDLYNDEESFVRSYGKERNEFCKVYNSLEDLDFEVESFVMSVKIIDTRGAIATLYFSDLLAHYRFADGTLFGVKTEEG